MREHEFAGKEIPLCVEHLEITVQTALIACVGEPHGVCQCPNELILLFALPPGSLEGDQRVGDFAQCIVDSLFIFHGQFALLGLREPNLISDLSSPENRQQSIGGEG